MPPIGLGVRLGIYAVCLAAVILGMLRIYSLGEDAQKDADKIAIDAANKKATDAFNNGQAKGHEEAAADKIGNDRKIASLQQELAKSRAKPANIPMLPADCKFDQRRIDWGNAE